MLDLLAGPITKVQTGIAAGARTCFLLRGVFDAPECAEIIDTATDSGFAPTGAHYPGSYRNNDRLVRGVAALPDGRLASASYDGTVRLWRIRA